MIHENFKGQRARIQLGWGCPRRTPIPENMYVLIVDDRLEILTQGGSPEQRGKEFAAILKEKGISNYCFQNGTVLEYGRIGWASSISDEDERLFKDTLDAKLREEQK